MSIHKKLANMVHLLELENQKILTETKKVIEQTKSIPLSKENALKIGTVKNDLMKQAEHIQSLKSEIMQKLPLNSK